MMDNGNMPAMPVVIGGDVVTQPEYGLTKREEFAVKIMAGIFSNSAIIDFISESSLEFVSSASVKAADALLAELESTKCQS